MELVLASGSVARAALLRAAGVSFRVEVAGVDEDAIKRAGRRDGLTAAAVAAALAVAKARAVLAPGALVLGADQMLECEGRWFDKPGVDGVRDQLLALRGRVHRLVTAAVCVRDGAVVWQAVAVPELRMRAFGAGFLEAYLAAEADAVAGCVGGYRLEGMGVQLFDAVEGEHAAVLGLPLLALLGFLRAEGVLLA